MTERISSYTQNVKKSVNISFTCENCGAHNSFSQELKGKSKTSYVSNKEFHQFTDTEATIIQAKALQNLESKVNKIKADAERGKFTRILPEKCSACKKNQSWQIGRLRKDFLIYLFLAVPAALLLTYGLVALIIWIMKIKNGSLWTLAIFGVLALSTYIKLIYNYITAVKGIDKTKHTKPLISF